MVSDKACAACNRRPSILRQVSRLRRRGGLSHFIEAIEDIRQASSANIARQFGSAHHQQMTFAKCNQPAHEAACYARQCAQTKSEPSLISLKAYTALQDILSELPRAAAKPTTIWRRRMTIKKTIANDKMTSGTIPSCSQKTTKSFISRERRFQDALEDDQVREVLRGFHQLSGHPPVRPRLVK